MRFISTISTLGCLLKSVGKLLHHGQGNQGPQTDQSRLVSMSHPQNHRVPVALPWAGLFPKSGEVEIDA